MRLTRGALITLLAALAASVVAASFAQTQDKTPKQEPVYINSDCPAVTVSCPSELMPPGTPVTFTANVSVGDRSVTPTFNWTVSAGTISSGQGTSSITVDTENLPACPSMTATVDVGGYDRSCSTSASCTNSYCCLALARKLDEYGDIPVGDEKRRLDDLTAELRNDQTAQGYLLCYGGRWGRAKEAQRRCVRAKNFLVISRGMDADRIVTVDGGYREELTVELWVVTSGATPPQASPTVDPSEVRPPTRPRRPRRR